MSINLLRTYLNAVISLHKKCAFQLWIWFIVLFYSGDLPSTLSENEGSLGLGSAREAASQQPDTMDSGIGSGTQAKFSLVSSPFLSLVHVMCYILYYSQTSEDLQERNLSNISKRIDFLFFLLFNDTWSQ